MDMGDLTVVAEEIVEPDETVPNQDGISHTDIHEAKTEGIAQPEADGYHPGFGSTRRCLHCGSPIPWASEVCQNCLADPSKDRRENSRMVFRKTFVYDDLVAKFCNLSRGGAQIKTRASLSVGELLRMAFYCDNAMLVLKGTVVYVHPLSGGDSLVGVKFTELTDRDSGLLDRFLCSHSIQKYPI
jgi:hypothetical protein